MLKIISITRDNEKGNFPLAGEVTLLFFALRKLELTMSIESLNAFSIDFSH